MVIDDTEHSPGRSVIEKYREKKDEMTDSEVEELFARLQDDKNRRRVRERRSDTDQ